MFRLYFARRGLVVNLDPLLIKNLLKQTRIVNEIFAPYHGTIYVDDQSSRQVCRSHLKWLLDTLVGMSILISLKNWFVFKFT